MLRPPSIQTLERLREAGSWSDRDLDRALCDVGVLPPVDLKEIRSVLSRPGASVSIGRNPDGHSILRFAWGDETTASIFHDGSIQVLDA